MTPPKRAVVGRQSRSRQLGADLVTEGSAPQQRVQAAFEEFRQLFPAALVLHEDRAGGRSHFGHAVLSRGRSTRAADAGRAQRQRLDRLWDELHFVSRDALTSVDAFAQLMEFATQDADPKVFEPMRKPINDRAAAFRQLLVDCEPKQVDALIDFAARAYRRPLTADEARELARACTPDFARKRFPHEEAFRLTLARVLVAPAFFYRIEKPVPGTSKDRLPIGSWRAG